MIAPLSIQFLDRRTWFFNNAFWNVSSIYFPFLLDSFHSYHISIPSLSKSFCWPKFMYPLKHHGQNFYHLALGMKKMKPLNIASASQSLSKAYLLWSSFFFSLIFFLICYFLFLGTWSLHITLRLVAMSFFLYSSLNF